MCGIIFQKSQDTSDQLYIQKDRGLDGVGIIFLKDNTLHTAKVFLHEDLFNWDYQLDDNPKETLYFTNNKKESTTLLTQVEIKNKAIKMYENILKWVYKKNNIQPEDFVFIHHRKASIGGKSFENVHPFQDDNFIIAQNGTSPAITVWGNLEGCSDTMTDTEILLRYISRDAQTHEEALTKLNLLSEKEISLGVIVLVCKKEKLITIYSDAERSLYVNHTEGLSSVLSVSSLNTDSTEYKTSGHITFDFNGNVIDNTLEDINKEKIAKSSYYYNYNHNNYSYNQTQISDNSCNKYWKKEKKKKNKEYQPFKTPGLNNILNEKHLSYSLEMIQYFFNAVLNLSKENNFWEKEPDTADYIFERCTDIYIHTFETYPNQNSQKVKDMEATYKAIEDSYNFYQYNITEYDFE